MVDTPSQAGDAPKRFRSPPYPSIGLSKAIERAKQLHGKALHHPVGVAVLADAWDYGVKSSGLWATAAALIQFGLLTDEGSGAKRKFQLTDSAIRITRDADPASEKRRDAIQRAALLPMIQRELWDKFGDGTGVSDVVLRNYLTLDRHDEGKSPYSDQAADEVIRSFKDTITFAGLVKSDSVSPAPEDKPDEPETIHSSYDPFKAKPKVGDYVRWSKAPSDHADRPQRVTWVSDDGEFLRIHGNPTGIPMTQVSIAEAPTLEVTRKPSSELAKELQPTLQKADISVLQIGDRLQITADVDASGIAKLKDMLSKYEEILKLLG